MRRSWRRCGLFLVACACLLLPALAALAAGPGWSIAFDPRHRAFLSFRTVEDGPRTLLLACLRDVDMLTVAAEGVADRAGSGKRLALQLDNGPAHYAVDGDVALDPDSGVPVLSVDIDLDAKARRALQDRLLPVLEGKGPIRLTVGSASRELPVAGLADPLERFKAVCFAR